MITDYLHLLHDPAHYFFEWTNELITGLVMYPFIKWAFARAIRRHDKEVHGE